MSKLYRSTPSQPLRLIIAVVIVVSCIALIRYAATFGLSRILSTYAVSSSLEPVSTNSLVAANEAVRLAPSDPQTHQARAIVLNSLGQTQEALKEIEFATSLRPRDDYLWLEVANLRDSNSETSTALAAFDNAVKFAPHYGYTHWQRGNLLVRMGRYDEGFGELRSAASSNPNYVSSLIDLAWGISRGDAQLTEQLIQLQDDRSRLVLARFLANRGKASEAMRHFRTISTTVPDEAREDMIRSFIRVKSFPEAFELWKSGRQDSNAPIQNGDFEEELSLNETGFGWQALQHDKVTFALDLKDPLKGSRSLRIAFDGYDNQASVLSQLLLVKTEHAYRISFAVKTRDLVTGGLPVLAVIDANSGMVLERSNTFKPEGNNAWTRMSFDVKTLPTTNALYLRLERAACSTSPCPIFGYVWLDAFEVEETRVTE